MENQKLNTLSPTRRPKSATPPSYYKLYRQKMQEHMRCKSESSQKINNSLQTSLESSFQSTTSDIAEVSETESSSSDLSLSTIKQLIHQKKHKDINDKTEIEQEQVNEKTPCKINFEKKPKEKRSYFGHLHSFAGGTGNFKEIDWDALNQKKPPKVHIAEDVSQKAEVLDEKEKQKTEVLDEKEKQKTEVPDEKEQQKTEVPDEKEKLPLPRSLTLEFFDNNQNLKSGNNVCWDKEDNHKNSSVTQKDLAEMKTKKNRNDDVIVLFPRELIPVVEENSKAGGSDTGNTVDVPLDEKTSKPEEANKVLPDSSLLPKPVKQLEDTKKIPDSSLLDPNSMHWNRLKRANQEYILSILVRPEETPNPDSNRINQSSDTLKRSEIDSDDDTMSIMSENSDVAKIPEDGDLFDFCKDDVWDVVGTFDDFGPLKEHSMKNLSPKKKPEKLALKKNSVDSESEDKDTSSSTLNASSSSSNKSVELPKIKEEKREVETEEMKRKYQDIVDNIVVDKNFVPQGRLKSMKNLLNDMRQRKLVKLQC